jgi:hypothetical protein
VLQLVFNHRLGLTLTMCRIQEFYKSPFNNIKGHVFTLENIIEDYATFEGDIDYFNKMDGFVIPRHILDKFFRRFKKSKDKLSKKEQMLYDIWYNTNKNYKYLVAIDENSRINNVVMPPLLNNIENIVPDVEDVVTIPKKYCEDYLQKEINNKYANYTGKVKVYEPIPGVLHLLFDSKLELTLSMCRIQEFYESPFKKIKGNIFTLEDFIEVYADSNGILEYFEEWDGFNIPKNPLEDFYIKFNNLTIREKTIRDLWFNPNKDYKYLIATETFSDPSTYDHELCHALWAIKPEYRISCQRVTESIPKDVLIEIKKYLVKEGYPDNEDILNDEVQAYLKTSEIYEFIQMFPSIKLEKLLEYKKMYSHIPLN